MEPFDIDNQTLNDLEIFESASNEKSIFSFFDFTSTIGGKEKLRSLFNHTDIQIVEERKSLIGYLLKYDKTIAFNTESLDFIEYYLRQNDKPRQASTLDIIGVTTRFFLKNNQEQYLRQRGAQEVLELIHLLYDFCSELIMDVVPKLLQTLNERVHGIINRDQKVTSSKNMMVIFDELFRGTNVKDAYDASLSIITAFSQIRNSFFIISTHIVEVAKELNKDNNINFCFLKTSLVDGKPMFTHKLKEGITDERMGMWIIENEGIMEILNSKSIS